MNEETKEELDQKKESYLRNYPRVQKPQDFLFGDSVAPVGQKIVQLLKKEELTYEDAYASLQHAHNILRYESNFVALHGSDCNYSKETRRPSDSDHPEGYSRSKKDAGVRKIAEEISKTIPDTFVVSPTIQDNSTSKVNGEESDSDEQSSIFSGMTFERPPISKEEYNALYEDYVRRARF